MWMPTDSRKGEDDHCWMKASRCLSTPSDSPVRPPNYKVLNLIILDLRQLLSSTLGLATPYQQPSCIFNQLMTTYRQFLKALSNLIDHLSALTKRATHPSIEVGILIHFLHGPKSTPRICYSTKQQLF